MRFSARSLSLDTRTLRIASSSRGLPPLAAVPFMGRVRTNPLQEMSKKSSGERLRICHSPSSTKAQWRAPAAFFKVR